MNMCKYCLSTFRGHEFNSFNCDWYGLQKVQQIQSLMLLILLKYIFPLSC